MNNIMELADLLVSYKLIKTPQREQVVEEITPTDKYNNMLQYIKTKEMKQADAEEVPQEGFPGWKANETLTTNLYTLYTPKPSKGLSAFNQAYDEVVATNPEATKYRLFLTKMAEQESGFNSSIQNRAGAPAYGYFLFMQDGKKYNNIQQYAGTDVETFRNNPKLQIEAAIKLAKSFEKGFSKEDLATAKNRGFSTWGLLGGAWLAGNGGVRKYLRGLGNPSDRHWSSAGAGTDVESRIKAFNF